MGGCVHPEAPTAPGGYPAGAAASRGCCIVPMAEGKVNLGCQQLEGTEELGHDLQIEAASLHCGVLERGASAIPPK